MATSLIFILMVVLWYSEMDSQEDRVDAGGDKDDCVLSWVVYIDFTSYTIDVNSVQMVQLRHACA